MEQPNPAAVVTLPRKCREHGVVLTYTEASAAVQDGKLVLLVKAEPHRGETGWCSRSYGTAIELPTGAVAR
jgi:hypothetical protein